MSLNSNTSADVARKMRAVYKVLQVLQAWKPRDYYEDRWHDTTESQMDWSNPITNNIPKHLSRTRFTSIRVEIYESFISHIPSHSKILDVGCGAGRDLK